MSDPVKTFYVTTPIYYVNAKPHLGHLYTTLIADTLARYHRQRGVDSFFLTGTDERGINIERAAAARGIPVQQHVDEMVKEFRETFAAFGIEESRWIRTTDAFHREGVQSLWRVLAEKGFIYKGKYEGWFCPYCNEYKDVEGHDENPQCSTHEKPLEILAEESYFFKLSEFQEKLLELYKTRPGIVQPESRRNEVLSFVSGGLKDISISRVSVKWGIPVPGDDRHTIYVWFDALANYITALGWGNRKYQEFDRYWPALHLVGKDIIRFHAVYWPAFLMAAGLEVPHIVFAHGMLLSGGRKMSKTLGNVIDPVILRKFFTSDQVRFFCLREIVFGLDGDFTYDSLIDRVNSDLAGGLGNLSSRTLTMIRNFCSGRVPTPRESVSEGMKAQVEKVRLAVKRSVSDFDEAFNQCNFSRGLESVWAAMAAVDKFISDAAPWNLAKETERMNDLHWVLSTAYEAVRHFAVLLSPVLPCGAQDIWGQLGQSGTVASVSPDELVWGGVEKGTSINEIKGVFPRMDKEQTMDQIKQSEEAVTPASGTGKSDSAAPAPAAPKAASDGVISIEEFAKVEMRVGTVQTAERIPKADRLLKLTVDIGTEIRQVLAGIALYYEPESLIGRRVVVVTNLAPRKMRGLESNGMVVAASVEPDGRPVLATFTEDVPNGARLK
ncbi:MAG: methionine--tRNA ligase [Acidobacteriia bacterium]|nr:methionine--tRNA ligase [Terriglobia bacterium]